MKGKFIKKLTAYALTAAMVVSTPMTAFATEFSENFWISDGVEEGTDTGTVSGTGTGTTTLKEYWESIEGIRITGDASITMKVGTQETLTAEVLYKEGVELSDEVKDTINKQIRWRSTDSKIVTVDAKIDSMTVCPINAKSAGPAYITAELNLDNGTLYQSDPVEVIVEESEQTPITSIAWDPAIKDAKFYAGHTYDLNEYLLVNGEYYYDGNWESVLRIAYATTADPKKEASIIQVGRQYSDGENWQVSGLSVSKSVKADTKVQVIAKFINEDPDNVYSTFTDDGSSEKDELEVIDEWKSVSEEITLSPGVPATKLIASSNKVTVDFGDLYNSNGDYVSDSYDYGYPVYPLTIKATTATNQPTTDTYTWTVKNPEIADVIDDPNNAYGILVVGLNVGKTTITFTSTSGKKVNVSVTVNATLKHIDVVDSIETWSGKTTPVESAIERIPSQNTDKLTITVAPAYKKLIKVKDQAIVPVADLQSETINTTFTVSYKKKNVNVVSEPVNVTVKQSNVILTDVTDADGNSVLKKTQTLHNIPDPCDDDDWYAEYGVKVLELGENGMSQADAWDSISWVSSKPSVASVYSNGLIVAGTTPGSAKITVSSVGKPAGSNKYKTYKKTFTVKCTPVCQSITLKSYAVANVAGKKVTLTVKQALPKKTVSDVKWTLEGIYDIDGNLKEVLNTEYTGKKLSYTIPATAQPGDTITVRVNSGVAETYATIHVLSTPTKKVQFTAATNGKMNLGIGQLQILTPVANSVGDVVTGYSVNKQGIVKVLMLQDGRAIVCGIGKGTVTVSASTASGKTAKVKITVQ